MPVRAIPAASPQANCVLSPVVAPLRTLLLLCLLVVRDPARRGYPRVLGINAQLELVGNRRATGGLVDDRPFAGLGLDNERA